MADIDHFKRINDTYGHPIGDKVLQEVARAIAWQCREFDLPARYGGEVCRGRPRRDGVRSPCLAERCRQEIAKVCESAGKETARVTASFGVAEATGLSAAETLIERADDALYRAKKRGATGCNPAATTTPRLPRICPTQSNASPRLLVVRFQFVARLLLIAMFLASNPLAGKEANDGGVDRGRIFPRRKVTRGGNLCEICRRDRLGDAAHLCRRRDDVALADDHERWAANPA